MTKMTRGNGARDRLIKIDWLFPILRTYLQHVLAYFMSLKKFDAVNVYILCITYA